ncbi:MAG: FAD-dependent oxidoreductase [Candidatus Ranarchaeia archaeon]|jgi:hypothetical protein
MKIKIVGAGLFGCAIAYELDRVGHEVIVYEKESDILQLASKCNHNRIHFGYHYPRSEETAQQSLDGMLSFTVNYRDALVSHFPNYYMIAANDSKTTGAEYLNFCDAVGINYRELQSELVNNDLIDLSIEVDELVFDYNILKSCVSKLVSGIDIKFNTEFDGNIDDCDYVINTSYANINEVNRLLGVSDIQINYQDVVVPIFRWKHDKVAFTIMDGPFFSVMPKGNDEEMFLLYSVEHSVLSRSTNKNDLDLNIDVASHVQKIYDKASDYYPFLNDVEPAGYYRTIRPLPINDDDGRVTEIFRYPENPKVISVLTGKVTTCHKIGIELANTL